VKVVKKHILQRAGNLISNFSIQVTIIFNQGLF